MLSTATAPVLLACSASTVQRSQDSLSDTEGTGLSWIFESTLPFVYSRRTQVMRSWIGGIPEGSVTKKMDMLLTALAISVSCPRREGKTLPE